MKLKPTNNYVQALLDVNTGDTITFMNEGKYSALPQQPDREVLTFQVKIPSGEVKDMSINKTSQKALAKAWTDQSDKWVNKQAKVSVVNQQAFGELKDIIYLTPADGIEPATNEEIIEDENNEKQEPEEE